MSRVPSPLAGSSRGSGPPPACATWSPRPCGSGNALSRCTLIGRLAVARDQQGQRLGSILLADALQRAFESASTVGSSMVIVDALDETAAGFYAAHGFARLPDSLRLVLPMRQAGVGVER